MRKRGGRSRRWIERIWFFRGAAIGIIFLIVIALFPKVEAIEYFPSPLTKNDPAKTTLPSLQVHPLPPTLASWKEQENEGDYFLEIKPTPLGYLIWSEFPIEVFIEKPIDTTDTSFSSLRFQKWVDLIRRAIEEWNIYLPLLEVMERESADLIIERSRPERKASLNRETGLYEIPPAQTAQTRYHFYLKQDRSPILSHRMTVQINPDLSDISILAAARHEIGHALGIWGHSPQETDTMYFSTVSHPAPISARDLNTLKKIYQQPTRLGWRRSVEDRSLNPTIEKNNN